MATSHVLVPAWASAALGHEPVDVRHGRRPQLHLCRLEFREVEDLVDQLQEAALVAVHDLGELDDLGGHVARPAGQQQPDGCALAHHGDAQEAGEIERRLDLIDERAGFGRPGDEQEARPAGEIVGKLEVQGGESLLLPLVVEAHPLARPEVTLLGRPGQHHGLVHAPDGVQGDLEDRRDLLVGAHRLL